MELKCILSLLKEKEHIEMYLDGYDSMPEIWNIKSLRGTEFAEKLYERILKDHSCFIESEDVYHVRVVICEKKAIEKWVEERGFADREMTRIKWSFGRLDDTIAKYLNQLGYEMKRVGHMDYIEITNLRIKEERIEKEREKEKEAIELLEMIE